MRKFVILLIGFYFISQHTVIAQNCNTNNLASGKTVTASNSDGINVPSNIVDGDMSTEWYGGWTGDQWLYVDLAASYKVCRVLVKWHPWHDHPDFKIQGSNNASTWTDLYTNSSSNSGQFASGNAYQFHDVDLSANTTSYRYVRIYLNSYTAYGGKIKELEIYDSGPPPAVNVSITSPLNNSVFLETNTVVINASASVSSGSITKVEFYDGGTKVGESTATPYRYILHNLEQRDYIITAKAISAAGANNTASITIKVKSLSNYWSLGGNSGADTNFIGTTNLKPVILKTNNIERMRINPDGRIGINTDTIPPGADVAVNGSVCRGLPKPSK